MKRRPFTLLVTFAFDSAALEPDPWWHPYAHAWSDNMGMGFRLALFGFGLYVNLVMYPEEE